MSSLIGVADVKISNRHSTNYQTNKTGGLPDIYTNQEVPFPTCQVCTEKLHLIVQLYCPLDGHNYHRTLYIFACSTPSCLNKPESWIVYRCQSEVISSPKPVVPPSSNVDINWGDDCDDWGDGDDDWGTSNDATNVNILGDTVSGTQFSGAREVVWSDNSCTANIDDSEKESAEDCKLDRLNMGETVKNNSEVEHELPLGTMCIEDAYDSEDDPKEQQQNVISEDIPRVSVDDKSQFLSNLGQNSRHVDDNSAVLESYFINVFDDSVTADRDDHVNRLIRDYERKEGHIVKDVLMETDKSGGGDGEKYEKTSLKHGDVYFHKFMKQIAMCHEQCVRYCWNGSPLYIRAPPVHAPNKCIHCNGDLVFELQLMPALVNLLKVRQDTDPLVEFGTVLIFTCRNSCWTNGESYRTEHFIVQSDPDQDRFK